MGLLLLPLPRATYGARLCAAGQRYVAARTPTTPRSESSCSSRAVSVTRQRRSLCLWRSWTLSCCWVG